MPLGILDIRWIKNDLGFYLENHSCACIGLSFWNEIFIQTFSPRDQVESSDLTIYKYSATQWIKTICPHQTILLHFEFFIFTGS